MPSADKMAATEVVGDQQQQQGSSVGADTVESLRREAEQLKAKLDEERAKLTDVDRKIIILLQSRCHAKTDRSGRDGPSTSHHITWRIQKQASKGLCF